MPHNCISANGSFCGLEVFAAVSLSLNSMLSFIGEALAGVKALLEKMGQSQPKLAQKVFMDYFARYVVLFIIEIISVAMLIFATV